METVGGNSSATGVQSISQVYWTCGQSSPIEAYPYDCTKYINLGRGANGVNMVAVMPRCWNGLDPTNRANFAYPAVSTGPNCSAAFPNILPLVNIRFHTGIVTPCPGQSCPPGSTVTPAFGFELANGAEMPWYQAHGDFMNGWQYGDHGTTGKLGGLDDLVTDCLIGTFICPPNPHTGPSTSNMPS